MRQGLGVLELALPVISGSDRFVTQERRQKNGAPAGLCPANGSPRKAFRIAPLPGGIPRKHRKQGISEVFAEETGCDSEGDRPREDGRFFAKAGRLGAGERFL